MQYGTPVLNEVANKWLEQVTMPLFLTSGDLKVYWVNTSGRELMRQLGLRIDSFGDVRANDRDMDMRTQSAKRQLRLAIADRGKWKNGTATLTLADFPSGQIQLYALSINGLALVGCAITTTSNEAKDLSELLTEYGLTSTEKKVVGMLAQGATASEIARTNGSSLLTVRTHIKRIYAKMGVHSREKMFARLSANVGSQSLGSL